ncbi:MAG: hypothetical protein Q7J34_12295 [Bacteroidales bacterium]|nr:hypothetical protein [Bacteroidales bacterium]
MKQGTKSTLLWVLAVLLMCFMAVYQRLTGPTHPERGKAVINNTDVKFKLLRSQGGIIDAPVKIKVADTAIRGEVKYRLFNTDSEWVSLMMIREGEFLTAFLPNQPPAGKLEYSVNLYHDIESVSLTEQPVVIRYKGHVPEYILYPHILLMFLAMVFSMRAGLEAMVNGPSAYMQAKFTLIFLIIGGLILGPTVQYFAFGEWWTGWPLGSDLTDNKTAVAVLGWIVAFVKLRKNPKHRTWVIVACLVLLAVYLIPHSMFGSELDYNTGQINTGK